MKNFISTHGLIHQTTCPNTLQQNGVAERKNRILLEITRALIFETHVPTQFCQKQLPLPLTSLIAFPQNLSTSKPHWKHYKPILLFHPLIPYLLEYSAILYMFTFPKKLGTNLNFVLLSVFLLGMG